MNGAITPSHVAAVIARDMTDERLHGVILSDLQAARLNAEGLTTGNLGHRRTSLSEWPRSILSFVEEILRRSVLARAALQADNARMREARVALDSWGIEFVNKLADFMRQTVKGGPLCTCIAAHLVGADEEDLPLVWLWATTSDQRPEARLAEVVAERDRLKACLDAALSTKPAGEYVTPAPAGAFVTLETCEWTQMDPCDFSDVWDTECGESFCFNEGGPGEDGIDYCCYCGKKIVPVKAKELGEEDEDDTAAIRDAELSSTP